MLVCVVFHGLGVCSYRLDDIVDQLLGFVDLLFCVCHDQTMEVFVLVAGVSSVRFSFALFHRAFASNGNLGAGVLLHSLESVTARADEEADC